MPENELPERPSFYEYDLDVQLASMLNEYQNDREQYWLDLCSKSDWSAHAALFQRAEAFAEVLLRQTAELVYTPASDTPQELEAKRLEYCKELDENRREFLRTLQLNFPDQVARAALHDLFEDDYERRPGDDSPLKLVWERLCIHLAWPAVETKITSGATRLIHLMGVVTQGVVTVSTAEFLRSVSRCFMWGFDDECIILCRSAMDRAFSDRFPDERDLDKRIKAAEASGKISQEIAKAAHDVRLRGNKAVHYQLGMTKDVLGTIRATVAVIGALG